MKQMFLFLAAILFSFNANSQYKVKVETGEMDMSKGKQMAFTVVIPESKPKDIEPLWEKYVNNRTVGERISNLTTQIGNIFKSEENKSARNRLRAEKKGDEIFARAINVSKISIYPMDVYARITKLGDSCRLNAFFQYTDSVFINETNADAERIMEIKSYIRDFGVEAYKNVVDDQIKNANREVSKQESLLKDIKSRTRREEKSIPRYESAIKDFKANISDIEREIKLLTDNITLKETSFSALTKGTPEYDAAKKELKGLKKDESRLFRNIKSLKGRIMSKRLDIKFAKNKISENQNKEEAQQKVIQEKQQIVDQLKSKKEGIQ